MKTIKLIFILFMGLTISNCSKDDSDPSPQNYDDLTRQDILDKESQMITGNITTTNDSGLVWQVGDVIVYKTSADRYGKFEILSIDQADNYKLTIKLTTFDSSGSVFISTNSLAIRGTYLCDLDTAIEMSNYGSDDDFHWNRQSNTLTYLTTRNYAKFLKYTF